uniref:Uncharacterized protein n=1 Tax=Candidatus Kentrum sp. FW TaxID=2126338 RepID=A0A450TN98_9GAMM|nr:MAG: hypothetical protein BECKFW1821C_GA0114237_101818 [Candidatus Kentron sp. FW]
MSTEITKKHEKLNRFFVPFVLLSVDILFLVYVFYTRIFN